MFSYARYAAHPGIKRYLPVVGFFMLGLMAKPMLVTLPFVLLLLDYWPLRRIQFSPPGDSDIGFIKKKSPGLFLVWEKIPLFLLALASSVVTFMAQKGGGALGSMEIYPFAVRVANALVSYVKYLGKMIWPAKLAVFYPHSGMLPVWQVIGAGVLLGLITFIAIRSFRQRPWFIVGWLWFIGTLVPVIGLVQIGLQAMADRYTYIPLIGVFIIVAWGVPELLHRWRHKEKLLGLTAISVIIMLGITSWVQTRYWKNTVLLFNHTIEVTDNNYVMHNNLGFALTARGRPDEAIKHYKEALRLNPDYEPANINLGLALLSQGKFDECIDYYQEVLRVNPGYARVHNNLGAVLWRLGKIEKATVHFRKAVLLKPDYAEAHNSLGAALIFKGEIEKAIAHLQKALRLNPDYALAKINLGKALAAQKKISDADTETPDT
jgi:Tfp pilus assembly protein PilF